jgi:hypothetical protein
LSCDRNGRKCADAARRNGIAGHISRYLNTITNWSSYRDVENLAALPGRLKEITAWFFGIDGRIRGVFGVMIATHLVQQLTGAVTTAAVRVAVRGRPFGRWRGITLRESPISPLAGRVHNFFLRGRVEEAKGFYFHESGRTWHCHVARYRLGDTIKTLNQVQSLSFPGRQYFFDRELPEQDVVDLVLGDKDPDNVPGYVGSINELDTLLGTKPVKQMLYFGNWLLVDEGERDAGGAGDVVDYDSYARPGPGGGPYNSPHYGGWRPPGSTPPSAPDATRYYGGQRQGDPGTGRYGERDYDWRGQRWSGSYRRYGAQGYGGPPEVEERPPDPNRFTGSLWDVGGDGRPRQTISLNGREAPVRVHGVGVTPGGRELANASYRTGDGRWVPIKDPGMRAAIAQDVRDGILLTEEALRSPPVAGAATRR